MNKFLGTLLVAALMIVVPLKALATDVTAAFTVFSTVSKTCKVTNPSNVDLGAYDSTGTATLTGTTSIAVKCVKGTAYAISLTSANSWNMKGGTGSELIPYTIKQPNNSTDWTTTPLNVPAVSSNALISYTANVSALEGSNVSSGNYSDTVTVTVTY